MLKNGTVTNSIEKFDTITREIELIDAKLNIGRCSFAVAKLENLVYIFGGRINDVNDKRSHIATNTVEVFNLDLEEIKEGKSFQNGDSSFTANIF